MINFINDVRQKHRQNSSKKCDYYVEMSIVADIEAKTKKLTATTDSLTAETLAQAENRSKLIKKIHKRNEKETMKATTDCFTKVVTKLLKHIDADGSCSEVMRANELASNTNQMAIESSFTSNAIETLPQQENESNLSKWCNGSISKT